MWGQQTVIDDVALIGYDPQVTAVTLGAPSEQIARARPVTDTAGSRRATLLIPAGAAATMALADGTSQSAATLHIRSTIAVLPVGPTVNTKAMSAGVTSVQFSKPARFLRREFPRLHDRIADPCRLPRPAARNMGAFGQRPYPISSPSRTASRTST